MDFSYVSSFSSLPVALDLTGAPSWLKVLAGIAGMIVILRYTRIVELACQAG